jgi:hypothetical protein
VGWKIDLFIGLSKLRCLPKAKLACVQQLDRVAIVLAKGPACKRL